MTAAAMQMESLLRAESGLSAEGSSELLLARARRGDLEALEQLYRAYEGPMYNLARRICATPEDAEEVLQEAFLEVIRSIGRFRGEGSIWSWIRKIAATKALMRLRSDRVRRTEALEDLAVEPSAGRQPEGTTRERRIDLEEALSLLTGTARAVVWLYDVEGYTHEEIAEITGRTVSFSKSQLSRAHARLRVWLGGPQR